jgi:hypothetical protein
VDTEGLLANLELEELVDTEQFDLETFEFHLYRLHEE